MFETTILGVISFGKVSKNISHTLPQKIHYTNIMHYTLQNPRQIFQSVARIEKKNQSYRRRFKATIKLNLDF